MLVCNVSLLRRRARIAADLTEAVIALDSPGTGNVVFATLVDDPASVGDFVDAYLGEIMLEAASASDVVNAGLTYLAAVDEEATAATSLNASTGVTPIARGAMLPGAFVNSPGTARQANVKGVMVSL
jgi:hypothetical protein